MPGLVMTLILNYINTQAQKVQQKALFADKPENNVVNSK